MPTLIRCRLSDGVRAAEEFSAQDGPSLARECDRAFTRYVEQHGRPRWPLELQVRPHDARDHAGPWDLPIRTNVPVRVLVDRSLLDRRPPDDWTEIWSWVELARDYAERMGAFVERVAGCLVDRSADRTLVQTVRDRLGYSVPQLASLTGYTERTVSRWLAGEQALRQGTRDLLTRLLAEAERG